MPTIVRIGILLLLVALVSARPIGAEELSDDEIKTLLIDQSIAAYSGNCPCPYSTMRNGRRCGGNSAYSKPGGAQPLCFATDVSKLMVERYRATHKGG